MEAVGVFHDEEWESLSKMFSFEDYDFQSNSNLFSNPQQSSFLADESSFLPSANLDHTNFHCEISQESSNSSEIDGTLFAENGPPFGGGVSFLDHDVTAANTFDHSSCNNGSTAPVFSDDVMREILHLKAELMEMDNNAGFIQNNGSCNEMQQQLKRKCDDSNNSSSPFNQSPKKKTRVSRDAQKSKKGTRKNKKDMEISNDDEENENGGANIRQSSSTGSSQEDSSNGKGKTSRGTATDPQSLYARRRRERINERLRLLQNLVPNGTKVDISTMLEEAVHYVKFLQLQIKLLSSDEMWMYAPIAYNGMDMGLYHKIMPNLWP